MKCEALYTGLNNLDKFAWFGSFSGAFVMWPRASAPAAAAAPATRPATAAEGRGGRGGRGGGPPLQLSDFEKNFPALDARANSRIKYLFIGCGTADGLVGVNRQFKAWLEARDVRFTEEEAPEVGHVWPLWRQNLADFVQKAFK